MSKQATMTRESAAKAIESAGYEIMKVKAGDYPTKGFRYFAFDIHTNAPKTEWKAICERAKGL